MTMIRTWPALAAVFVAGLAAAAPGLGAFQGENESTSKRLQPDSGSGLYAKDVIEGYRPGLAALARPDLAGEGLKAKTRIESYGD
jgi:hypothetical protein